MNTKRLIPNVSHSLHVPTSLDQKEVLYSAQKVVELARRFYADQMMFGDNSLLSGTDLMNALMDYDRVKNNQKFFNNNL